LSDRGEHETAVAQYKTIDQELNKYADTLAQRERWLVFNKTDLLTEASLNSTIKEVCEAIQWNGPIFAISAVSRHGTDELCHAILDHIETSEQEDKE